MCVCVGEGRGEGCVFVLGRPGGRVCVWRGDIESVCVRVCV